MSQTPTEEAVEQVLVAPSDLLDLLVAAFEEGARAVHEHPLPDPDPSFTEAAWDYVSSLDFTATTRPHLAAGELNRLREEVSALRADKDRLDYLDAANAVLNARYGTTYGWKLIMTHNVNRLMIGRFGGNHVDLHDSEGGNAKLPSCRAAIDERIRETRAARGIDPLVTP